MKGIEKILFISFAHIGDIVRFTPLLNALRMEYPHAYIACLFPEGVHEILACTPVVNAIIPFPHEAIRKEMNEGLDLSQTVYTRVYHLIRTLTHGAFDLVINPFEDFGAIIAGLIKPRYVLGRVMTAWGTYTLFGEEAARFYYLMSKHNELRIHATDSFSDAALGLMKDLREGNAVPLMPPELSLGKTEEAWVKSFLHEAQVDETDFLVGFQMRAKVAKNRMWPLAHFAELINRIKQEFPDVQCVLLGTKDDAAVFQSEFLPQVNSQCIMAAGKTRLRELAALLKRLNLMVSVDTGPMHMAACFHVPIIALFGRMSCVVNEAKPYGHGHTVLIGRETKDISVDQVWEAVREKIQLLRVSLREDR